MGRQRVDESRATNRTDRAAEAGVSLDALRCSNRDLRCCPENLTALSRSDSRSAASLWRVGAPTEAFGGRCCGRQREWSTQGLRVTWRIEKRPSVLDRR